MTDDTVVYLTVSLVSLLIGTTVSAESSVKCTPLCVCDTWYGLARASCTGSHLYNVYAGVLNNEIQALDLSNNVISALDNFEVANLGLTKLKYLNLSTNAISEISLNAFDNLTNLTVLDLSTNRLHYILDNVFEKNPQLRVLKLSRNNFNHHVPKLRIPSLTELSLDSCQISHLPPDTFNGLTHVLRLDLSNNLMIQMSYSIVQKLYFLQKISLQGNPWSCNKLMKDLETYLKRKRVEFDNICGKKVKQQKFEKMIVLNYHHSAIPDMSGEEAKSVTKYNVTNTVSNNNRSACERAVNNNSMNKYMPFWFLLLGFFVGVSSGLIISYIWLSGKLSCKLRRRRDRRVSMDEITHTLHLWNSYFQFQDDADDRGSLIESCPGTPPPAYREVMLRPSLYPSTSNSSNNDIGYSGRY